jgi:hypothetical protein
LIFGEKKARPSWEDRARFFSSYRAAPYLLQRAHSSHLALQQAAQSLSLQHSGQLVPAAWTDASAATKARAMAVIMDFMIFPCVWNFESVSPGKNPGTALSQAGIRGGGTAGAARRSSARSSFGFQRWSDEGRERARFFSEKIARGWA